MKRYTYIYNRYIAYFLLTLLLLGGAVDEAWAYKVTYHVLTLPIDASAAGMVSALTANWTAGTSYIYSFTVRDNDLTVSTTKFTEQW